MAEQQIYIGGKPKKKVGKKRVGKKPKGRSWQAKELNDMRENYKPAWNSKEGKRQANIKRT